jgi:hypothetical protein
MPSSKRKRRERRRSVVPRSLSNDAISISGRVFLDVTVATGAYTTDVMLNTSLSQRLVAIATCFINYRFNSVRIHLLPAVLTRGTAFGISYLPEEKANNDFPIETFSESGFFLYQRSINNSLGMTVPTRGNIPAHMLRAGTSLKWYSTGTGFDPEPTSQGALIFGSNDNSAGAYTLKGVLMVEYNCLFTGARPPVAI